MCQKNVLYIKDIKRTILKMDRGFTTRKRRHIGINLIPVTVRY